MFGPTDSSTFFLFVFFPALVVTAIALAVWLRRPSPRRWILLVALAAAAGPVGVLLHNVISGITRTEEAVFFLLALVVAPAAYLIGIVGAAIAFLRLGTVLMGASLIVVAAGVGAIAVPLVAGFLARGDALTQLFVVAMNVSALALIVGTLGTLYATFAAPRRRRSPA